MHTKRRALAALACFAGIAFGIPGGVQTPAHHSAGDRVSVAKVTTAPNFEIRRQTKAIQESSNWSGYAQTAGGYTSVSGTWNVPTGEGSSGIKYAAQWIRRSQETATKTASRPARRL